MVAGLEPGLRRRRGILVLPERRRRRLLRADRDDRPARRRRQLSGLVDYGGDRYGAHLEYLKVGDNFNPEVGFVARDRLPAGPTARLRFSPRPKSIKAVRKFTWQANFDYFENGAGVLETRDRERARSTPSSRTATQFTVTATRELRAAGAADADSPASRIPAGSYEFDERGRPHTALGAQRRVVGHGVAAGRGSSTTAPSPRSRYSTGASRVARDVLKQFSLEAERCRSTASKLPRADAFTTRRAVAARADYGVSPLMFASALLQYSSSDRAFSSNLRFRWEYRPGSELFVVYTDGKRDHLDARAPDDDVVLGDIPRV